MVDLSPETSRRVDILFSPDDRAKARELLVQNCGNNLPFCRESTMYQLERVRFAALKYSDGDLGALERAVTLAQRDWRDLLMATGFANDVRAHQRWIPKPAGEPAEIDASRLAASIHDQLACRLGPLGFVRQGDTWSRCVDVPQHLKLLQGLTSRAETCFFLQAKIEAQPTSLRLHLPRLPSGPAKLTAEQGFVFRTGYDEGEFLAKVDDVLTRDVLPFFHRFTSPIAVQRGLEDGTFGRHLRLKDEALLC